jgi:hypothetical protein
MSIFTVKSFKVLLPISWEKGAKGSGILGFKCWFFELQSHLEPQNIEYGIPNVEVLLPFVILHSLFYIRYSLLRFFTRILDPWNP